VAKAPGSIRDSIFGYLQTVGGDASIEEVSRAVVAQMGATSPSSVRSYLNNNVGRSFERTGRGRYRLSNGHNIFLAGGILELDPVATVGRAKLYQADCFEWLASEPTSSIHACVTDPPYGVLEYTEEEQEKLRKGKGWCLADSAIVRRSQARAATAVHGAG